MSIAEKLQTIAENEHNVFNSGARSEYNRLWDALQKNGTRTDYQAAFSGWTAETFKPKYDIRPKRMNYMFYNNAAYKTLFIEDFVEHCKNCGIVFDTSQCANFGMSLGLLFTRRMGVLDFSSMRNSSQQNDIWYGNGGYLQTIDELIMSELTELSATSFKSLTGLINMTVTGVIGKNNFNVSYCTQLTSDSLMSIINALKDYSEDTSGTKWVVTFGTENLAKLTDAQKAIATEKGWTLA